MRPSKHIAIYETRTTISSPEERGKNKRIYKHTGSNPKDKEEVEAFLSRENKSGSGLCSLRLLFFLQSCTLCVF